MNFTQFLQESREDYIAQQQGPKIMKRYHEDNGNKPEFEDALQIVKYLTKVHPKYIQWIVKQYIEGRFKLEDRTRIKDELEEFDRVRSQLEQKDINQYKTLKDLYNVLDVFSGKEVMSANQIKKEMKSSGADKLIDNAEILMYKVKTKEAAMLLGKGTRWCTAAINNNMFDHYNQDGPLFVIIDKENNAKYQIHLNSQSCMDAEDDSTNIVRIFEKSTIQQIMSALSKTSDTKSLQKFLEYFGELVPFTPEKTLLSIVQKDKTTNFIFAIPPFTRSKEMCLAAFNNFVGAYVAFPERFKTLDLSIKYATNLPTGSTWEAIPEKHRGAVRDYIINLRTIKSKANNLKRAKEFNNTILSKTTPEQQQNPEYAPLFKNAVDDIANTKTELAGFRDYIKQLRQQKREMAA